MTAIVSGVSGISDTVARQQTATFVDYLNSQGRFYSTTEKAAPFTSQESICGKKVAVQSTEPIAPM